MVLLGGWGKWGKLDVHPPKVHSYIGSPSITVRSVVLALSITRITSFLDKKNSRLPSRAQFELCKLTNAIFDLHPPFWWLISPLVWHFYPRHWINWRLSTSARRLYHYSLTSKPTAAQGLYCCGQGRSYGRGGDKGAMPLRMRKVCPPTKFVKKLPLKS